MHSNQPRTLKIEASGDFWLNSIKPKIRLCGNWLEHAGFQPGERVRVISTRPGELTLQQVDPAEVIPHA